MTCQHVALCVDSCSYSLQMDILKSSIVLSFVLDSTH